ncbi:hypothetical protein [Streptomyces roseoviridis]|uniref:Uncharacterized protein n=1 Tax=Streptomyces roseoviridis TaxID=67361 RepID=A0ABV5QND3_9ACTN
MQPLMNGETSEDEGDDILDDLRRGLACPHISDYIFWDFILS